jgi:hypothetical protein
LAILIDVQPGNDAESHCPNSVLLDLFSYRKWGNGLPDHRFINYLMEPTN